MIDNLTEAIAHAKKVAENVKYNANTFTESDLLDENCRQAKAECLECAAEHEQLAEWLTELQERRDADRWISVKDKLPDKEGRCLVFTDYGDVTMDSFVDGMFVCNLGNVTHWRPLPPKPEESEDK